MRDTLETILSIIPQAYYDFIAKIIPGFISIEILWYLFYKHFLVPHNVWEIIFGVIVVYILGLILDIGGLSVIKIFRVILTLALALAHCKNLNNETIHEKLHNLKNIQDANIIVKMLAETVLLRSLSVFLLLFTSINGSDSLANFLRNFDFSSNEISNELLYILLSVILFCFSLVLHNETYLRADAMPQNNSDAKSKNSHDYE